MTNQESSCSVEITPTTTSKSSQDLTSKSSTNSHETNSNDDDHLPVSPATSNDNKKKQWEFSRGFIIKACIAIVILIAAIVTIVVATSSASSNVTITPTMAPSSSPTLGFLEPPSLQDCTTIQNGQNITQQQDWQVHKFELLLEINMGVLESQSGRAGVFARIQAMLSLQQEIQGTLVANLVGCTDDVRRRQLRHSRTMLNVQQQQYIVGNGMVQFMPDTLQEQGDCSSRICFAVRFSMDLFLKSDEAHHVAIVEAQVSELFATGVDLVTSVPLESLVFDSVLVQSVIYHAPTMSPSTMPTSLPTTSPTNRPTRLPSLLPTQTPSIRPTLHPTKEPSSMPTMVPTLTASLHPTNTPTTMGPTRLPTLHPTLSPTLHPSTNPSGEFDGYYQPLDRLIRIACAGDSLTKGRSGGLPGEATYPFQLQQMMVGVEVNNYGRNAATAMRGTSLSYADHPEFVSSLEMQPDIYLLMLGTNDSRLWAENAHRFPGGMEYILRQVQSLPSAPRILLGIPPWVQRDNFGISNSILAINIRREIEKIAQQENLQLVDLHAVTVNRPNLFLEDGLHLNQQGYGALATSWKEAIECNHNGFCEVGETCGTCPSDCYRNCL